MESNWESRKKFISHLTCQRMSVRLLKLAVIAFQSFQVVFHCCPDDNVPDSSLICWMTLWISRRWHKACKVRNYWVEERLATLLTSLETVLSSRQDLSAVKSVLASKKKKKALKSLLFFGFCWHVSLLYSFQEDKYRMYRINEEWKIDERSLKR